MKKNILKKLIIFVLVFMALINGMLPTKFIYAGVMVPGDEITYNKQYVYEDSYYVAYYKRYNEFKDETIEGIVENFGEPYIYYIDKATGERAYPKRNDDGSVYLEYNVEYFVASYIELHEAAMIPYYADTLKNVKDAYESFLNGNGVVLGDEDVSIPEYIFEEEDEAPLVEGIISDFFLWIGSGLYSLVSSVVGEDFSIESVIFNKYSNTRLTFFNFEGIQGGVENGFIKDIKPIMNEMFDFFTGIALAVYLIILVYMGIKILLGSTAEKGSRYKELCLYWFEGILILFLFPYVMKYSIQINDSFVSFIYANKGVEIKQPIIEAENKALADVSGKDNKKMSEGQDYMSRMFYRAKEYGWLVYTVCWYVMFFQMIGFLIVYFKRVLIVMFLIVTFPLVMISYAIDKIGDAKSQAFGNWVKEYMVNIFNQSFHAITYVLIMTLLDFLVDNRSDNWLLMLIIISFVSKGDDILRNIFAISSGANTVKGVGASLTEAVAISGVIGGVKSVANGLFGKGSMIHKLGQRAGNIHDRAWEKIDNRAQRTGAEIEDESLTLPPDFRIDSLSNEEIEEHVNVDIQNLLGKNKDATDEDVRNSADRLTAYLNQDNNGNVQKIIDKAAGKLSDEDKQTLDNLLKQNAAANGIIVGGNIVDINQNIRIVLECLRKDKNGKLTKESNAILNKIVNSEDELLSIEAKRNRKYKEDNSDKVRKTARASNKNYYAKRDSTRRKSTAKGRTAIKDRNGKVRAKNDLDYMMRTGGLENVSKVKEKKKETWKNVESNEGNAMAQTSRAETIKNPADRAIRYKVSNGKIDSSVGNTPRTVAEVKKAREEAKNMATRAQTVENGNKTAFKIKRKGAEAPKTDSEKAATTVTRNTQTNTTQNVGADIANKQGTAENLQDVINREDYISAADTILNGIRNNGFEGVTTRRLANKDEMKATMASKSELKDFIDVEIKKKSYDKETKRELETAVHAVEMLKLSNTGEFTARETLNLIKDLKEINKKYENASVDEREAIRKINDRLGYDLSYHEATVRIDILNDPSLVKNNPKIIDECISYVQTNSLSSTLLDELKYNVSDLEVGREISLVRPKKTSNNNRIVSEEQKTKLREEYEAKMRHYELRTEIDKRTFDDENKYSAGSFVKDTAKLVGYGALTAADAAITTVGGTVTGAIATGMATNGKGETLTQAGQNFFAGVSMFDSTYDTVREDVVGIYNDARDVIVDDISDKKQKPKKKFKNRNIKPEELENIKDKTKIKTPLFSERGKK